MRWFRKQDTTSSQPPKSYLYVSDAKVQMLIEGLDPRLRERFDLKIRVGAPGIASTEISSRQRDSGRFDRARRVCSALEAQGRIGDMMDANSQFFRGELLATWGFHTRRNRGYADVVFFSGYPDVDTLVGLGGSAYHTMERAEERIQRYSNSGLQQLMYFFKEQSEATGSDEESSRYGLPGAWCAEGVEGDHNHHSTPEHVEFVAERLADKTEFGTRVIIGTPIYVARTGRAISGEEFKSLDAIRNEHAIRDHGKPRLRKRDGRWQVGKLASPQAMPPVDPSVLEPAKEYGDPSETEHDDHDR